MTNTTRKWIRAGLEAFIHGGTAAVTSSVTATAIDPKDWGIGSHNQLKLAGIGFLVNGGMRFVQWWQNNPLPPEVDGGAPIGISPLSKVAPNPPVDQNPQKP